jgi:hypothetical protein
MALFYWPKQLEKGAFEVLTFLQKMKVIEIWSPSSANDEVGSFELFTVSKQLEEED